MKPWIQRACKTVSTPFRLVLLRANCVAKPRRSSGYACVWRLVSAQNNFVYSVSLIILQALSVVGVLPQRGHHVVRTTGFIPI